MQGKIVGIKKFWRWFVASFVFKFFIAVVIVALILFDFYRGFYLANYPERYEFFKMLKWAFNAAFWGMLIIFLMVKWLLWLENVFLRTLLSALIVLIVPLTIYVMFYSGVDSYATGEFDDCMAKCVKPDNSNFKECSFDTCDFVF